MTIRGRLRLPRSQGRRRLLTGGVVALCVVGASVGSSSAVPRSSPSSPSSPPPEQPIRSGLAASPSPLAGLFLAAESWDSPPEVVASGGAAAGPTIAVPKEESAAPTELTGWREVRTATEDFSSEIDRRRWGIYNSPGHDGHGLRRPSAVTTGDGVLRITGRGDLSGGMAQKHSQIYGRWEIRARQDAGVGYGPAILLWPDSGQWPEDGEIDIVEMPRGDRTKANSVVHWGEKNSQKGNAVRGDFTKWHTYAVEWLPDRITFFLDGQETFRVTEPDAIPNKPMHLALQNDVGRCGSWIGCRDATTPESVSLHIDWIRVYEQAK